MFLQVIDRKIAEVQTRQSPPPLSPRNSSTLRKRTSPPLASCSAVWSQWLAREGFAMKRVSGAHKVVHTVIGHKIQNHIVLYTVHQYCG
jgi:hypothetical protein